MTTQHKHLKTAQRIDFDRFDELVSDRITALKLIVQNFDKMDCGADAHDAICRDLIMPNIHLLAAFLDSVKVDEQDDQT